MNNKNKYVISALWLIDFIVMFVLILLPKNEKLFNMLYPLFMVCIFFVPAVLIVSQLYIYAKQNMTGNQEIYIPTIGCVLLMSLILIRFVGSIKKDIVPQMIVIFLTFILAEVLIGYLLYKHSKYEKRKYFYAFISIYMLLVLFFFTAMIISYDHSVIW